MAAAEAAMPEALERSLDRSEGTAQDFDLGGLGLDSHVLGATAKPRLTEEERLGREVARRRQQELERRQRIFDAKRRTIGLDLEALEAQKADKLRQRQQEAAESKAADRELNRQSQYLSMLEMDKRRTQREMEVHCQEYSLKNLPFESRREFDLNDPHHKRKGLPARVGDGDPRCGPSSMQRFAGEDLLGPERKQQQRLAMANFLEQQKFEKAMLSGGDRRELEEHAREVAEMTAMRNEIEEQEADAKRQLLRSNQQDILQQGADDAARRKANIQMEMERNQRELDFHKSDPFLQETAPKHNEANGRLVVGAYKGSTREEREQVAQKLLEQADRDAARKHDELLEDHLFARAQEQSRKQMVKMERERARMRRTAAEQAAKENKALGAEQRDRMRRNDQLYTNEFRPEFFEQFGTSTR